MDFGKLQALTKAELAAIYSDAKLAQAYELAVNKGGL